MIKLVLIADVNKDLPLIKGKVYEGELTPKLYDTQTLEEVPESYIIKCNDNKFRKVEANCFISLREGNLNKLLNE